MLIFNDRRDAVIHTALTQEFCESRSTCQAHSPVSAAQLHGLSASCKLPNPLPTLLDGPASLKYLLPVNLTRRTEEAALGISGLRSCWLRTLFTFNVLGHVAQITMGLLNPGVFSSLPPSTSSFPLSLILRVVCFCLTEVLA